MVTGKHQQNDQMHSLSTYYGKSKKDLWHQINLQASICLLKTDDEQKLTVKINLKFDFVG